MPAVTEETWEDALLMLASVRSALINRCKHYDQSGNHLKTEKEIMQVLLSLGEITVDAKDRMQLTTDEEQLVIAKREFSERKKEYIS